MLVVAFYRIAFSVMYVISPWIHIVLYAHLLIYFTYWLQSCTQLPNGSYTKDLSLVQADLSRVCLIDNSPVSYTVNEGPHDDFPSRRFAVLMPSVKIANGIPIEGWTHDPSDEALLDLLPVLDSLRFTSDVRRVLGLRSAGVSYT